ncbi:MAG: 4-hydroxybenzoate octaprenyltransferase [Candidatus Eremiobacteraeota bacterium]|nr:4-hydroxybenzoate octaprenyltransferase [Candidatus Eremiobacteraeota bacterium]
MTAVHAFLKEIRVEHTLFALPFAYVGAIVAAHGLPPWPSLFWITIAVLGARTAAMAANRYFDREIDARNPRTAGRGLATGAIDPKVMMVAIAGGLAVLTLSAAMLAPLCLRMLPIAIAGVLFYPLCKRFWWGSHFVLGAVDALAPLGAYVAIANTINLTALLLFAAVLVWVAGFDIVYALMDVQADRAQGLLSIPARFHGSAARVLPLILHVLMVTALALAGYLAGASWWYFIGILAAAILLILEEREFEHARDVFVLNDRIFVTNMVFSVAFLGTTLAGFSLK